MGIKDDWDHFKDPVKQSFKNLGYAIEDAKDDFESSHEQEQPCEDLFMPIAHFSDELHGISSKSPRLVLSTSAGMQRVTYGTTGVRIEPRANGNEALYAFYTDISMISQSPANTKKGLGMIVGGLLLGFVFTWVFLILSAYGVVKFLRSMKAVDIALTFMDEDTQEKVGVYVFPVVSRSEQGAFCTYLCQGIDTAIKHETENPLDDFEKNIAALTALKRKISEVD